jgi:hypothetical protein
VIVLQGVTARGKLEPGLLAIWEDVAIVNAGGESPNSNQASATAK